jgi:hypothetical protein
VNKSEQAELELFAKMLIDSANLSERTLEDKLLEIQKAQQHLKELEEQARNDARNAPMMRERGRSILRRLSLIQGPAPVASPREKLRLRMEKLQHKLEAIKSDIPEEIWLALLKSFAGDSSASFEDTDGGKPNSSAGA